MILSQTRLRQILGVIWIIDGLLQLQPQMFTSSMISGIMVPMTQSQPWPIASSLHWIVHVLTYNLALMNIVICAVQVTLGALLLFGYYVRQAVIASGLWALGVWYGGEGMSALLTGHASVLTGAPGAVLLYPLIGLAIYPRDDRSNHLTSRNYPGLISRHQLRLVYGALWIFFAGLQLQPYWWGHGRIGQAVSSVVGMGGWNGAFVDPSISDVAGHFANGELALNLGLIVISAAIGVGLMIADDQSATPILTVAAVVSFVIWWFGQALGGIFTGMSTDFNSGLLLIVIAVACIPRRAVRFPAAGLARIAR